MAETIAVEEEVVEKEARPVLEAAHKALQVGLGATAYGVKELETLFTRLVERGEVVEQDGRKRFNKLMEQRKKRMAGAQDELETSITRALHRLNVPTRADIDTLNKKVTPLTKKVNALLKEAA